MPVYRRGSLGPAVVRIQARLGELGHYLGPHDGIYGGGTESAVRRFQRELELGLDVDGLVGPLTWEALFRGEEIPPPALLDKPVDHRCLALTGAFETGAPAPDCFAGLTGDFDDQGISFGVLQWNFGQGSLQPLLEAMDRRHADVVEAIFGDRTGELRAVLAASRPEQLEWARSIQDPNRRRVSEPWRGLFLSLGRREECQEIQRLAAADRFARAVELAGAYSLSSERGVALMFDIVVQNGSIGATVRAQIERDVSLLPDMATPEEREVARMRIIANRRAEAARPQFIEDVRARKLTIANGGGRVHGRFYNLDVDYGLRLQPLAVPVPAAGL